MQQYFDPLERTCITALQAALPHATQSQVASGCQFAPGALLHYLIDTRVERLSDGANRTADPRAARMLLNFILGRLRAPLSWNKELSFPTTHSRRPAR